MKVYELIVFRFFCGKKIGIGYHLQCLIIRIAICFLIFFLIE